MSVVTPTWATDTDLSVAVDAVSGEAVTLVPTGTREVPLPLSLAELPENVFGLGGGEELVLTRGPRPLRPQ